MSAVKDEPLEFDQPWKWGLEWKLEDALRLFFPAAHQEIDWSFPYESLDTELAKLAPDHLQGALTVDKLFKVRLKNGEPRWLYVHVEIQAQKDGRFEIRMWTYNYRLCDRYGPEVVSLAILADDDPRWRPCRYHHEFAGCVQHFEFPVFKVLDCVDPERVFERTHNPFALLVAAHQAALRTRGDPTARGRERLRLIKYLYGHGMRRDEVKTLFRLMAWLTKLPQDLELKFRHEVLELERERKEDIMTLETLLSPTELAVLEERRQKGREEGLQQGREQGREQGLQQGLQQGLLQGLQQGLQQGLTRGSRQAVVEALEVRFGLVTDSVRTKVQDLSAEGDLRRALRLAVTSSSLERFLQEL